MRCKICDADHARLWKGDYYCQECRTHIHKNVQLYFNREWLARPGEIPLVDREFDDA